MKGRFMNGFAKVTGYLPQKIIFRTKILYEDKKIQGRSIKGPAIIISNHTNIYDYAVFLFVFWTRTLRYQIAEVMMNKRLIGPLLKSMGGIYVDRDSTGYGFITESEEILRKGGVVGIFPESRLPREGEERPLPFKTSAAYIALSTGAPVIPVYVQSPYFKRNRIKVVVGTPMDAAFFTDPERSEKENLELVTKAMRDKIISLGKILDEGKEK